MWPCSVTGNRTSRTWTPSSETLYPCSVAGSQTCRAWTSSDILRPCSTAGSQTCRVWAPWTRSCCTRCTGSCWTPPRSAATLTSSTASSTARRSTISSPSPAYRSVQRHYHNQRLTYTLRDDIPEPDRLAPPGLQTAKWPHSVFTARLGKWTRLACSERYYSIRRLKFACHEIVGASYAMA